MELTKEAVQHLAALARLELSADEVERYSKQLGEVLGYVEQLRDIKTSTAVPSGAAVELRPDVVQPYADVGQLVALAPEHEENLIVVPPVFDGQGRV